ncbi:MAG TPA: SIR2 family protein [Pyrinomonadaceae bacterium]|nr:SIR2 family protein [Pyrinomonadaceae bacterium]
MAVLPPTTESNEAKELVLAAGKCVAFLGAGITKPPGGTWTDIVSKLADRCKIPFNKKTTPTLEYPKVIDLCIAADEDGCNEVLRVSLAEHVVKTRTALVDIHRLQLKAIVTTNFDPWIGARSSSSHYERIHVYPDLPLHFGTAGRIYYIHGHFASADPNSSITKLVFGQHSFAEAYEESPLLSGFLLNLFIYENIFFVGFDPTERYISALLRKSIEIRGRIQAASGTSNVTRRYILTRLPSGRTATKRAREAAFITGIKALDITPVYYDNSTEDHVGIEELLYKWIADSELPDRPALLKTGFDD